MASVKLPKPVQVLTEPQSVVDSSLHLGQLKLLVRHHQLNEDGWPDGSYEFSHFGVVAVKGVRHDVVYTVRSLMVKHKKVSVDADEVRIFAILLFLEPTFPMLLADEFDKGLIGVRSEYMQRPF